MLQKKLFLSPVPILICLFLSLILSNCSNSKEEELPTIDVFTSYEERKSVPVSKFGESIEYVLLETTKDCQIGEWTNFYLDHNIIIVVGFRQIFLFDRTTGKYIKQLGHWGKDPHGYKNTRFTNAYDYRKRMVRTSGWKLYSNQLYSIESDGESLQKLPWGVINYIELANGNHLGYIENISGTVNTRLVEYSPNDTIVIQRVPNYRTFINNGTGVYLPGKGTLYKIGSQTFFYELYTDTVFRYNKGQLYGHMRIELGKLGQSYDNQVERKYVKSMGAYALISELCENQEFVFFRFSLNNLNYYYGLFDKRKNETLITKSDKMMIPGFKNDFDGFIDFPLARINPEGYAIGAVQALDVIRWMDSTKTLAPPGIPNIDKLNEYSNPLVMIVKLKKY